MKSACVLALAVAFLAPVLAVNSSLPELTQRSAFPMSALQFSYDVSTTAVANGVAGQTLSMDISTDPILATLPNGGLSSKVDNFAPCAIKVPHVHPRANKWSYVAQGTLTVAIVEEDTGRSNTYVVPQGNAIVVPQGLIHSMWNNNCNQTLQMLSVFTNADAGELTLMDKILSLEMGMIEAATGLDQATIQQLNSTLPRGPGDLRVGASCLAACNAPVSAMPSSTAG